MINIARKLNIAWEDSKNSYFTSNPLSTAWHCIKGQQYYSNDIYANFDIFKIISLFLMAYVFLRDNSGDTVSEPILFALLQITFQNKAVHWQFWLLSNVWPQEEVTIVSKPCQNIHFKSLSDWDVTTIPTFTKTNLSVSMSAIFDCALDTIINIVFHIGTTSTLKNHISMCSHGW